MLPQMLLQQLDNVDIKKENIQQAFAITSQLLRTQSDIDCTFSGTTTVICLSYNDNLFVANLGDSRAIIQQKNGVKALSRDHKPDAEGEKERILATGGRVQSYLDGNGNPLGPARVWLQSLKMPGLAMARSFGDNGQLKLLYFYLLVACMAGVIAEPEIYQYKLSQNDKFIVIASDGVFEFLSNEQVASIVEPFYKTNQPHLACEKLVKEATLTCDYLFKIVIIGNAGVGKSSLLLRFSDDQFNENYLTTLGVDFRFKTVNIDGKNVKLQIWDTAGQERFRTITNAYYKGAHGIIIVYDTTNEKSFVDVEKFWLGEIEQYGEKNVELMLLGNKNDLDNEKKVDLEIAQSFARDRGIVFYETSAKASSAVNSSFIELSKILMTKHKPKLASEEKKPNAILTPTGDTKTSDKGCC